MPCNSTSKGPWPARRQAISPPAVGTTWAGHCCASSCNVMVVAPASATQLALDLGQGRIGRVDRGDGLGRAQHHAHQGVFVADVVLLAVDTGRHRDQIALAHHGLPALAVLSQITFMAPRITKK